MHQPAGHALVFRSGVGIRGGVQLLVY